MRESRITSPEVAAYEPLVESVARRYKNLDDVEEDDLMQEGRIAVWEALESGYRPTDEVVGNAMRKWVRKARRRGMTGFPDDGEGDG